MQLLKKLMVIFSLISLLVVAAMGFVLHTLESEIPNKSKGAQVLNLPPGYINRNESPHYQGPHPSLLDRPDDYFQYPITVGNVGPIEPLFAGKNTYPFLCMSQESYLGQPLIDNHQGIGIPVFAENQQGKPTDKIVGYSKDCLLETKIQYLYKAKGQRRFYPYSETSTNIEQIEVDGKLIDFIVRVETGTINRYIYTLIALAGPNDQPDKVDTKYWNGKLIYAFKGGVGIGFQQGKMRVAKFSRSLHKELAKGYAVAASTATTTDSHYNIWLTEDTVTRIKKQFSARYGNPIYTVGVGGSGGAIQQYLLSQNNPEILDAGITQYSYPDMATQIPYVMDCELLEYYFDVTDRKNKRWQDWEQRQLILGLNAINGTKNIFTAFKLMSDLLNLRIPSLPGGSSECVRSWRAANHLVINPKFSDVLPRYSKEIQDSTHWSHWENLKDFYGVNKKGFANRPYDNIGIQYGLMPLINDQISIKEFIQLNQKVGAWKPNSQMTKSHLWTLSGDDSLKSLDLWASHNMQKNRNKANSSAMEGSYRSGHVFLGKLNMPVIDFRHYLEDKLDMHHSWASFSTRQRIKKQMGHADHQLIWMTRKPHNATSTAFEVLDEWVMNFKKNPQQGLLAARPANAQHRCYDKQGTVIAKGPGVWDGQWNQKDDGQCLQVYPNFSNARMQAGEPLTADIFQCALMPVKQAIKQRLYGHHNMQPWSGKLEAIFPQGVCDYSKGDQGRPEDLLSKQPKPGETISLKQAPRPTTLISSGY